VNQHVEGNLKSVFARRGELLLVMISAGDLVEGSARAP